MFGGLPDAEWRQALGELIDAMDRSVEELGLEPPAWWQRGHPMQLTMAALAEHVVVQEEIVIVAVAEPAGDEPAAAGGGAGDDKPAEPCTSSSTRASTTPASGSRIRLPVPLLAARAPWNPQQSWPWQTSCPASGSLGRTLARAPGDTWHRLPLQRSHFPPIHAIIWVLLQVIQVASSRRSGPR